MTTGAPRAICTESCNFLRHHCSEAYTQLVTFVDAFGYNIKSSCENTFLFLQEEFGFPCSSSSLQNECVDLLSMYVLNLCSSDSNLLTMLMGWIYS